ncbi:ATP-dependent DNA helicase PIF1 [Grifola frondosa]|uniref:ATP-dependent DNA helicase PIF1 n=1 Tax=Grifola frondosa TaxID=5627 RepID=A0A1C7MLL5_GRIFR|nr:ATP-dependent DNA helicase PIF1 [Grifola frondosa]
MESLIAALYPGIEQGDKPDQYFLKRTILSSKNDAVDDINHAILEKFPGEKMVLMAADKVIRVENAHYPIEYLNTINVSGLPLAHLALKPGCPLMLLHDLNPANGLCNGTHMILITIKSRVLHCQVLRGNHAGKEVYISRITIKPSSEDLPIPLSRRQFPVHLTFAMTINKAQGQSVINVGLDLHTSVFSHGQLYVALSRCTSPSRIKVLFPLNSDNTTTVNIVYPEVLTNVLN